MNKKKVIIGTYHVWDSPYQVGSHQYARCFARAGWDVAYISTPITPFHILYYLISGQRRKVLLPQRWKSWIKGGIETEGIWTYVPFGIVPVASYPVFNSRWAIEQAGRFLIPPIRKMLSRNGFDRVDLIWLDNPIFGFLLDTCSHDKSVLRIADEISGFPEMGSNIIEAELRLIQEVSLVVATVKKLEQKAKDHGAKRVLLLQNGADFRHFSDNISPQPSDLSQIPAPRVIYVGAIERWFNNEWVEYAASKMPDVSFVIIGNYDRGTFRGLEGFKNVYFLGKRSYNDVPAYLKYSDVGIIPFKKMPFIESVNPIKLYEYMACGLPVVSARWKALEEIKSPAYLVDTPDEFLNKLEESLKVTEQDKNTFIEFAAANSWERRFERLVQYI